MPTHRERLAGGLVGLLVGDALGVPYEFNPSTNLPPIGLINFEPPPGYTPTHAVPPGTWSDDGAQALCLLASLLDCGRLDAEDVGRRLLAWHDEGYLAVDGCVFDVGVQTGEALAALKAGTPALRAGAADERANGNGSLMRVLPLALWHRGGDAQLARDAALQSQITHGHARAQLCCALYCLWARRILEGAAQPWAAATATVRTLYAAEPMALRELDAEIRPEAPPRGRGGAYVVDCLHSVRWAVEAGQTYEQVVKLAVSLGNDTDTTACLAGGIAGLQQGIEAIPERWMRHLRGSELYKPLLERLLAQ
ncbi:ADP-ribosylglycohydrolase family protein [Gloeobacter violaceus]|uniref:Glr0111 protein n=1 Tax=Gloeobacter violaceus (strain ATCC 29082 / PCC 7421) TaxID=251221 RepID=Q7NPE4_GLOVI|nr:ADP-ribosylglycohydrolase family protein [Gloeobacter violaceus]BAC88052.1 glr0111 [Gloeobacter violaceus PCC 7421]